MKKKIVEDAQKALKIAEAIQSFVSKEVGDILMTSMQVKWEQGSSKVVASEVDLTKGNVSNNTHLVTIDLDPPSLTQKTTTLYYIPLSSVYKNLEKALPPLSSAKTSTKNKSFNQDDVYKSLESGPFFVKPLNIKHLDEDLVVTEPYKSIDARMEALAKSRNACISKIAKSSDTSSNPTKSSTSNSPVIDTLSQHLNGEFLDFVPSSKIASETALDIVVSKNQG